MDDKSCECESSEKWNPDCPVHTIGHYYKPGCCTAPEDDSGLAPHRVMSRAEYEAEFPVVYDGTFTIEDARYRLEARRYWDGVGATFTHLFEGDADSGICFDFGPEIIGPLIEHLTSLKAAL